MDTKFNQSGWWRLFFSRHMAWGPRLTGARTKSHKEAWRAPSKALLKCLHGNLMRTFYVGPRHGILAAEIQWGCCLAGKGHHRTPAWGLLQGDLDPSPGESCGRCFWGQPESARQVSWCSPLSHAPRQHSHLKSLSLLKMQS